MKKLILWLYLSAVCLTVLVLAVVCSGRQTIDNRVQSALLPQLKVLSKHYLTSAKIADENVANETKFTLPKEPNCQGDSSFSESPLFTYLDPLLAEYQKKHKIWRNNLLMGDPSVRTLTWYCNRVCGGIGDRVRGLLLSLLLAVVSERLFLVQWTQPFVPECQTDIFEPAAINWNIDRPLVTKIDQLPHKVLIMMASLNLTTQLQVIEKQILSTEAKHLKIKTNIRLETFPYFFSHFGNYTKKKLYGKHLEDVIKYITTSDRPRLVNSMLAHYLLAFSNSAVKMAKHISSKMGIPAEQKYVAVHIRTGFLGIWNEVPVRFSLYHKPSTWRLLLDCAINKSQILGTHVPIVLFTDSPVVKSWAAENYKARIVVIPGVAVHIDKMTKRGNMTLQEVATGAELVIMSRASLLVQGYRSGFSTVALEMCPIPYSNIFDMQKCTLL